MNEVEAKWELSEMFQAFLQAPIYHLVLEGLLMMWVLWLLFRKSYNPQEKTILTEKEKEELIAEWKPEPLVPDVDANHPALHPKVVSGKLGKEVQIDGVKCLNVATTNFLGMIENPKVEEAAIKTLRKYGVGSCGPRGFYGTIDVHLDLENRIERFLGIEEAVLYSYGFSTIASAIPAYSKRGDIIFADDGSNFAIQKGLQASRSDIRYFKHNDMKDLERLLELQDREDQANPKKAKVTRRFLVVEGIYINYGDICPLLEIIALKNKFKVRLFIDESISFAVLGATGRGITEHFGVSTNEVDLICASLEYSVGSTGGFSCGTAFVVDHQRLSGLGYCFSASLPPMLASAAIVALDIMAEQPEMLETLRRKSIEMQQELEKNNHIRLKCHELSPIKHIYLTDPYDIRELVSQKLDKIIQYAFERRIALVQAKYLEDQEDNLPAPSIRIAVNSMLSTEEIKKIASVIQDACDAIL